MFDWLAEFWDAMREGWRGTTLGWRLWIGAIAVMVLPFVLIGLVLMIQAIGLPFWRWAAFCFLCYLAAKWLWSLPRD